MAYMRTSRGLGAAGGMPAGVSISGSCDPASGQPSGNQTGYYLLVTPTGNQCLTDAAITALYPPDLSPVLTPGPNYIPNQTSSAAASPVVCSTPQCIADMAALNAGSSGSAIVPDTMLGPFDVTQIEAGNFKSAETATGLMVLAACALGIWLLMGGGR